MPTTINRTKSKTTRSKSTAATKAKSKEVESVTLTFGEVVATPKAFRFTEEGETGEKDSRLVRTLYTRQDIQAKTFGDKEIVGYEVTLTPIFA